MITGWFKWLIFYLCIFVDVGSVLWRRSALLSVWNHLWCCVRNVSEYSQQPRHQLALAEQTLGNHESTCCRGREWCPVSRQELLCWHVYVLSTADWKLRVLSISTGMSFLSVLFIIALPGLLYCYSLLLFLDYNPEGFGLYVNVACAFSQRSEVTWCS